MFRKLKKLKDDVAYCRLERMLRELVERGHKVATTDNLLGVVCDDGIVIFNFEDDKWGVCMVKNYVSLPDFWLRLTEGQMQEFNGGKGIKQRVYKYRKDSKFKEDAPCKK